MKRQNNTVNIDNTNNDNSKILAEIQVDLRWMKESFEDRLTKLEENNTWISRLVIGTIITAMIGTILLLKK
jgi:hypothetical protein